MIGHWTIVRPKKIGVVGVHAAPVIIECSYQEPICCRIRPVFSLLKPVDNQCRHLGIRSAESVNVMTDR